MGRHRHASTRQIVDSLNAGLVTQREIAAAAGCSLSTVTRIKRYRTDGYSTKGLTWCEYCRAMVRKPCVACAANNAKKGG